MHNAHVFLPLSHKDADMSYGGGGRGHKVFLRLLLQLGGGVRALADSSVKN